MLELISITDGGDLDSSFNFQYRADYQRRPFFQCYFHIKDEENKIIYVYTQEDIETNFYFNNMEVNGLIKDKFSSHLIGFEIEPYQNKVKNLYLYDKLYKIVYGTYVDSGVTPVVYKNLRFKHGYNVTLKDLNYEWSIQYDKYIKGRPNYNLYLSKAGFSYYKETGCDVSNCKCIIEEQVDRLNEWLTINHINTYKDMFRNSVEAHMDLSKLNTKNIFDFEGFLEECSNLETVVMCDFDTSMPIVLFDMFTRCYQLKRVDFRMLSKDYPEDNFGLTENITTDKLFMGAFKDKFFAHYDYRDSMVFIFNNKTPRFTKQCVEANGLKFLGKVKKEKYTVDSLLGKVALLKKKLEGPYYIVEEE